MLRTLCFALVALVLSPTAGLTQDRSKLKNEKNQEDRPAFKQERERFVREMHRAEPGLNWQAIDQQTRQMKAERAQLTARNMLKRGQSASLVETFPNGLQGQWIERGSNNQAGRVHTADLDQNSNTMYIASSYGNIFKRQLDQRDWTSLNETWRFNDIRLLRALPGVKTRLIALANGPANCYYTENDGRTWDRATGLESITAWGGFRRGVLMPDRTTIFALGNEWNNALWKSLTVLYRSTDRGASFAKLVEWDEPLHRMDIWASPTVSSDLFLVKADTIFRYVNGTFEYYSNAQAQHDIRSAGNLILQGRVDNGVPKLRVMKTVGNESTVYRVAQGNNWIEGASVPTGPFGQNSFCVSQDRKGQMYIGGVEMFRTFDDGASWRRVSEWWEYYDFPSTRLHADIPAIEIVDHPSEGEQVLISTDGGLFVSKDGIESVSNITLEGIGNSQYYSVYSSEDHNVIFVGSQDQGFQQAEDLVPGTLEFVQTFSGDYGHIGSSNRGEAVWTDYPGFLMVYPNAIVSSEKVMWNFQKGGNRLWIPPLVVHPEDPYKAIIANGGADQSDPGAYLWEITHSDESLTPRQLPFDFSLGNGERRITALAISELDTRYWYVLTSDGLFFSSTDGGESFVKTEDFAGPGGHYFYGASVQASKRELGKVFIAGSGYSTPAAYITSDHGKSWQAITNGLPQTLIFDIALDAEEQRIYAGTAVGPYVYDITLDKWTEIQGLTAPDQVYWSVEFLPTKNVARFATHGRGVWDLVIQPLSVPVISPTIDLSITATPSLANDRVSIAISSSQPFKGAVRIFDLVGRMVGELHSGPIASGGNSFSWDASNVPSGSYTVIVTGEGLTRAARLQVLR